MDRVKPLKFESVDTGGTENDEFPTSLDKNEDHIDCRGVAIQNDSSDDEVVNVTRDSSNNLIFKDGVVSGNKTLTDLAAAATGVTEEVHKALRQLIHFLDNGPGPGFGSGPYYEETSYSGIFPISDIWYETSSKLKKIYSWDGSWTGVNLTTETFKIYDTDGSTVLAQAVDAVTYSGIKETSRTRTITVY